MTDVVEGHGNMVMPITWFDAGGKNGMKSGRQCNSGQWLPKGRPAFSCMWFTNNTQIPGEPTLDESLRTYHNMTVFDMSIDFTRQHPWRSPGAAPVFSPCGVAGGNPNGCPVGAPAKEGVDCPGGGFSYGPYAEKFNFSDVQVTEWRAGEIVEAAWGIIANHGGGYSYRLCKVPKEGVSALTEKCFQSTPLDFYGDKQWVQYGEDSSTRLEFVANRTRTGTTPPGSQWTKNPIPACDRPDGGYYSDTDDCPEGTQFKPPADGLLGFGEVAKAAGVPTFKFSIGDYLKLPADLEPGDYVLSFRWDCEQSPQIWNSCSNINILPQTP